MQHAPQPPARPARREEGFGLIEVLVTSVIVIVIGTAVFAGLDAASGASGRTKSRSIASTLAQRDQERLRAMRVADLNNRRESSDQPACDEDGKSCQTYTISSRTQWIADSTGTASCTTTDDRADYMELISTVTWGNMRGSKPVVMKSIYSPPVGSFGPNEGSLAVKLVGADGVTPMPGITVRLAGPKAFVDKTNALGCVVWGYLPASTGSAYTLTLNEAGYVDPRGIQEVIAPADVTGESLTTRTFLYDRAATARVSFFSKIGTTTYADQLAERITLAHAQMSPNSRGFPIATPTSAQLSITTPPLFPFGGSSPYRIFGGCAAQDPANQATTTPPDTLLTLSGLAPGAVEVPYALQLPAIDTRITVAGAAPAAGNAPRYKITPTSPSCGSTLTPVVHDPPVTGANAGRLMDMGRPYGTYTVCAQATVGGTARRRSFTAAITSLGGVKVPATGTPGVIDFTASTATGSC